MDLKIFDNKFNLIGVIDSFDSLIWTRKYNGPGEFFLSTKLNKHNKVLLRKGNIILKDNEAVFIEDIKIEGINITCKGRFLLAYLERRIIWGTENIKSNVENAIRQIVNNQCINTSNERKIPGLQLGPSNNLGPSITHNISYKNVLGTIEEIAEHYELGIDLQLDIKSKKLIFKVYQGVDKTKTQKIVPAVIFSSYFENIFEESLFYSNVDFKNVTLIAGAGEGATRKKISLGYAEGLERYEVFTDAKDIRDKKTITINTEEQDEEGNTIFEDKEVTIPTVEYNALLKEKGNETLAEHIEIFDFDCTINTNSDSMKYKIDYDLGDRITLIMRDYEIRKDVTITEIEEVYENGQREINLTFGTNTKTIKDKIKKIERKI